MTGTTKDKCCYAECNKRSCVGQLCHPHFEEYLGSGSPSIEAWLTKDDSEPVQEVPREKPLTAMGRHELLALIQEQQKQLDQRKNASVSELLAITGERDSDGLRAECPGCGMPPICGCPVGPPPPGPDEPRTQPDTPEPTCSLCGHTTAADTPLVWCAERAREHGRKAVQNILEADAAPEPIRFENDDERKAWRDNQHTAWLKHCSKDMVDSDIVERCAHVADRMLREERKRVEVCTAPDPGEPKKYLYELLVDLCNEVYYRTGAGPSELRVPERVYQAMLAERPVPAGFDESGMVLLDIELSYGKCMIRNTEAQ